MASARDWTHASSSLAGTTRLTRPSSRARRDEIGVAQSSISMRGAGRNDANQRNHRRCAEEADLHAGRGEAGILGGHGQVAGRDKLTARRRRQAVHPRDDRLLEPAQTEHHPAAQLEQRAILSLRPVNHLREVVARREDGAVAGDHHDPGGRVRCESLEMASSSRQYSSRKVHCGARGG